MDEQSVDRRHVLATTGTALAAGLAGCSGGSGDSDGGDGDGGDGGDSTPAGQSRAVEYLEADPAANGFDGSVMQSTGQDEVAIDVGAGENGLAFSPAAIIVSTGTTISFEWTGEGGLHNVVSTESDTYDGDFSSDFDFDSGDPKESGDPFEQSFDNTGVALYHCEPHATVGMKGAIIVSS